MKTQKLVTFLAICLFAGTLTVLAACAKTPEDPQATQEQTRQQQEQKEDQKKSEDAQKEDEQKKSDTPSVQPFDKQIIGTWEATHLDWKDPDKEDMDTTALEARQKESQMGFYLTFKDDGTGAFYAEDLMYEVRWKVDGNGVSFPMQTEEREETVTVIKNADDPNKIDIDFPAYTVTMKQISSKPDDFTSVTYAPPAFKH